MGLATMRTVIWAGPSRLEQREAPVPEITAGQLLVRVSRVGICGSDLAILRGEHARARPGTLIGHEFTGTVAASRADGPPVGSAVAVRPLIACADRGTTPPCRACASGHSHVCAALGLYGVDEPGGLAEYVAIRAAAAHPVDPSVDPGVAALAEPLAVAVHAVERSGMSGGDDVAVFGAGPIGLFTALAARYRGAGRVVLVEPNAWRRGVAESYGFPVVSASETVAGVRDLLGGGADVVFDSAGHPAVARQVTEVARIRGTVVVVGVYKSPPEIDLRTVNFAEQHILGTRVYAREDFVTAVDLLGSDALELSRLPVTTFPLARTDDAFAAAAAGEGSVKVLIDPHARENHGQEGAA